MIAFFKKYWSVFALALLILSICCPSQKYQFKSTKQPNVTFVCNEPIWIYWIHRYTVNAEPCE